MSKPPRWEEIVAEAIRVNREELYTALPGRVRSYDATKKTATIELQLKRLVRKRDGSRVEESIPPLPNVPVGQLAAGSYFVHLPVATGDFVWVWFAQRSVDAFRAKGRVTAPNDQRMHDLSAGFAMPVFDISAPPSDAVANKLALGRVGGPMVAVDATHVHLGDATGTAPVARADKVDAEFQRIWNMFSAWVVVAQDGGAALKTLAGTAAAAVQSTAATKVKAT